MRKLFQLLLLFLSQLNFGQGAEYQDVYPSDVIMPKFKEGGLDVFYDYINKNFDFSKVTKPGTMVTAFTVDEFGEIKNIRVIQFASIEAATEIIRVLKSAPKWEPALKAGIPFSVAIKFPLIFKSSEKETEIKTTLSENNLINSEKSTVYAATGVEVKPEFKGGLNKFYEYISKNYRTPEVQGLKGKLLISFVVEKDGSIADIKVLKDIGYGTAEEAIRILKNCPKWTPAEQQGKKVRCAFMLPLNIQYAF
jgi:hypothetical protein